jgi:hypothetical protein
MDAHDRNGEDWDPSRQELRPGRLLKMTLLVLRQVFILQ